MTSRGRVALLAGMVGAAGTFGSGCAVNPATGQRQLSLISEAQEVRMGQDNDPQIVSSMGLYGGAELQSYVQRLGSEMAARTERPQLPWTFRVIDDPVINAFAVPGGYIYVTRGILAHFNSEAQLAAVLGHEIGHVTARHSVTQMSAAQLAQVGLVAGAILVPGGEDFVGLASAGLGVLFLKFSRDDERQSDDLGLRYMVRAGYDPRPMPGVYAMLARVSAARGGGRTPEWLSTHPNPENREERMRGAIAAMNTDFQGRTVNAGPYLRRLDGMVYGENPRNGFFEENVYKHPDLAFQVSFPASWQTANQRQAVVGASEQQNAIIQISLAEAATPGAAAQAFFAQQGVAGSSRSTSVNGLPAAAGDFSATTEQGTLSGTAAFVAHGGNVFQLLAYGTTDGWSRHGSAARGALGSFQRLTDRAALDIQPMRLSVVEIDRSMTLQEFANRYPSVAPVEELALINQAEPSQRFASGTLLKRVVR